MQSLYLLIPIALFLVAIAIGILYWAISRGQYDDLDMESKRILFDDPDENPDDNLNDAHDGLK